LKNPATLYKDNKRKFRSFPALNDGASRLGKVMGMLTLAQFFQEKSVDFSFLNIDESNLLHV